jgi:hypothetical protein
MSGFALPFPKRPDPNSIYGDKEWGLLNPLAPGLRQEPGRAEYEVVSLIGSSASPLRSITANTVSSLASKYGDGFLYHIQVSVDTETAAIMLRTGKLQGQFFTVQNLRDLGNVGDPRPYQWTLTKDDPANSVFTFSYFATTPDTYLDRLIIEVKGGNTTTKLLQYHIKRIILTQTAKEQSSLNLA